MQSQDIFIGIDVCKDALDVHVSATNASFRLENSLSGLNTLIERLQGLAITRIVLEATGGYERLCASFLSSLGLPVAVVNPREVRDFARAKRILAKTDRLDARVLALFADVMRPPVRPVPSDEEKALRDLVTRRGQLLEMATAEENRLKQAHGAIKSSIQSHLDWLRATLSDIEDAIEDTIKTSPSTRALYQRFQTVPGVGATISFCLLSDLPEIGRLSRKQIASLVGLAPFNRDSGKHVGHPCIWGGRSRVRSMMYMAAVASIRWNPVYRSVYDRHRQAGKPAKVALVAIARKLLTALNAMARDQSSWIPALAATNPATAV